MAGELDEVDERGPDLGECRRSMVSSYRRDVEKIPFDTPPLPRDREIERAAVDAMAKAQAQTVCEGLRLGYAVTPGDETEWAQHRFYVLPRAIGESEPGRMFERRSGIER